MMRHVGPKPSSGYLQKKSTKNMQQFAAELQNAVDMGFPSNFKPYNGVYVLVIHWSNDNMNVAPLEDDLCQVFTTIYGYTVESFVINAALSQYDTRMQFRKRLGKFMSDYHEQGNLIILVYSGHAAHINYPDEYQLAGDLDNESNLVGPILNYHQDVAPYVNDTVSDFLVIVDSCYTYWTGLDNATGPEVLAASTWHTPGAALSTSFTQNLINELKRLNGNSASVASIYGQIHRSTKIYADIVACPLHVARIGRDSIILSKLQSPITRNQAISRPLQTNDERVLISVCLTDDSNITLDLAWCITWLTNNLPSNISKTQITIEGIFDSASYIILVSMPIEVWTMLPDGDEAYSFISFVKSGSCLLPRQMILPAGNTN